MAVTLEKKENDEVLSGHSVNLPQNAISDLVEENLENLQENFFLNAITHVSEDEDGMIQKAANLKIPAQNVYYTVCVFEIQVDYADSSFDVLLLLLRDALKVRMQVPGFGIYFCIDRDSRLYASIYVRKPEDRAVIEPGVAGVIQQLRTITDIPVLYGVGTSVDRLVRLCESCDDAVAALERFRHVNDTAYAVLTRIDEKYRNRETIQSYLMDCFRKSDFEEIGKAINSHTAFLLLSSRGKQPLAERFIFSFLQSITNECMHLGVTLERFESYVPAVVSLMQSDIDSAVDAVLKLTEQILKYISVHRTSESNHLLSMAKNYIRENMGNETLNLEAVSDHVGLSRVYFCKLFHQMEGISFSTYLRNVRIERAKQLLLGTNMKVFEISNAVGFSHAKYFSQVFRQMVGMTPVEFQKGTHD